MCRSTQGRFGSAACRRPRGRTCRSPRALRPGLINISQQIGGALGLAILATIANSRTQSLLHANIHSTAVALTKGFDRAFLIGAGFAVAGALLAALLISSRDSHEHSKAARSDEAAGAPAVPVPYS